MKRIGVLCFLMIVGCSLPVPTPGPGPNESGDLNITVIEDKLERSPENSVVIRDTSFWHQQRVNGHNVRFFTTGTVEANDYKAFTEKVGIPALIIQSAKSGKTFKYVRMPNDTPSVQKLISKYESKRGPPVQMYQDSLGEVHGLGLKPSTPERKAKLRQQFMGFGTMLESKGLKLIPRDKWVDVEVPHWNAPEYVINQGQTSSCVGASAAAAAGKTLEAGGKPFSLQSGPFIYAHINNGRDSGAYIDDALETLQKNGTVPAKLFDYKDGLYLRQIPASVKTEGLKHQLTVGYLLNSEAELATAIQMGFVCQAGVQVDGSFERFDSNGVSSARGRYANHSIHIDGMKQINGEWCYHMPNTWGAKWGPFNNGSCYLRPAGVILEGDAFVHADYEWDASELPIKKRAKLPLFQVESKGNQNADRQIETRDTRLVLAQ